MAWWTDNYHWVFGGIGGALLAGVGGWALRRLFKGSREAPQQRQEAGVGFQQAQAGQAETVTVTRPDRRMGWAPRREASQPRTGAIGAKLLKPGLGVLAGALVVGSVLYTIALLKGVPITALPAPLAFAVAGPVVALWILIGGVYQLGRMAMRRWAKQFGVRAGSGVSSYEKSLVLFTDPTEALAHGRAAVLALEQGAELDSDGDAPDEVVGRTGRSERSFGEIIRIRVQPTMMRRAAIEIQSRPATWQLFDGGINAENVAAIARNLEARASRVEKHQPVADGAPTHEDTPLTTWDWLALAYLAVLAGYTGFVIALKELWPDTFAAWAGWLDAVPLDPLRLLGHTCSTGDPAAGYPIVLQLNILILPTLLAYSAYNTVEFRRKRDRMDTTNWILCLGSLLFLPLLVLMGCSPDWGEGLSTKYRGLVSFMLEESVGGAVYALLLVIFSNGVSYLPALVLARMFGTESKL